MACKGVLESSELWYFPPFFTLQQKIEQADVCTEQLKQWDALLMKWCCEVKSREIPKDNYLEKAVFKNAEINRKVSDELFKEIIDWFKRKGRLVEINRSYYLLSAPEDTIPDSLIRLLKNNNFTVGCIITVLEIKKTMDKDALDLFALPDPVLKRALEALQKSGNIALYQEGPSFGDETGIKILSL